MAKRTVSKSKDIKDEKKLPKVRLLEEYYDYSNETKVILTTTTIDRIARELRNWARTDDNAFKISQFVADKGIAPGTWKQWLERYPELAESNKIAKRWIGIRRELGIIHRKVDSGQTAFMMPLYDEDWKEIVEWRSNLKLKEGDGKGETFIVLEKSADSPLVPVKKEEE